MKTHPVETRYREAIPEEARWIGDVSLNLQLPVPLSRRDHGYWRGDLYLHEGKAYLDGEGGPASPFSRRVPQQNASIGGKGILHVPIDKARFWARRAGIEDEELNQLADQAETNWQAYCDEQDRYMEENGLWEAQS